MSYEGDNIKSVINDLQKFVINTPVLRFDFIDSLCNCNVFFKCENFQRTGSFKYRAAINAIKNMPVEFKQTGVITHSSGNFAPKDNEINVEVKKLKGDILSPK